VGHCSAEISNSFISNKFSSFAPEELEATLFHNDRLAFKSFACMSKAEELSDICIIQGMAWDLQTDASSTSLLPVCMHTPVASIEKNGGMSTWLGGMFFLTVTAVLPFLPGKRSVH
jgi:hypothetical protein